MNVPSRLRPSQLRLPLASLLLLNFPGSLMRAQQTSPDTRAPEPAGFSLIPNAFRRDPTMNLTVFTEMTEYGRTFPEVSPASPAHFIAHSRGFRPMGKAVGGEDPPAPAQFEAVLHHALNTRGFVPATEGGPSPDLALIYYWGSHAAVDSDDPLAEEFPEVVRQYIIERASLVGGREYAQEIAHRFEFGTDPSQRSAEKDRLVHQSLGDLYYVVVSAYTLADLAKNDPKLLWRTTMTVNAYGLSMGETLAPLVNIAGVHFGRPTDLPVMLRRTISAGSISIGPLEVIDDASAPPPPESRN